jgi:hypothetical protein
MAYDRFSIQKPSPMRCLSNLLISATHAVLVVIWLCSEEKKDRIRRYLGTGLVGSEGLEPPTSCL